MCHSGHVEVREQIAGVSSLRPLHMSWRVTSGSPSRQQVTSPVEPSWTWHAPVLGVKSCGSESTSAPRGVSHPEVMPQKCGSTGHPLAELYEGDPKLLPGCNFYAAPSIESDLCVQKPGARAGSSSCPEICARCPGWQAWVGTQRPSLTPRCKVWSVGQGSGISRKLVRGAEVESSHRHTQRSDPHSGVTPTSSSEVGSGRLRSALAVLASWSDCT